LEPRVVARRHPRRAQIAGEREQAVELQVAVAYCARIRGPAAPVLAHEVADDRAELVREIDRVERNPEKSRHHARIPSVSDAAAPLLRGLVLLDVHAVAHEEAHQGLTL